MSEYFRAFFNSTAFWFFRDESDNSKSFFAPRIEETIFLSNNSFITKCEHHSHKQKHFFCSYHNTNFCRECIKQFHRDDNCCIVDLFDIHKLFLINEENTSKNEQIIKIKKKEKEQRRLKDF